MPRKCFKLADNWLFWTEIVARDVTKLFYRQEMVPGIKKGWNHWTGATKKLFCAFVTPRPNLRSFRGKQIFEKESKRWDNKVAKYLGWPWAGLLKIILEIKQIHYGTQVMLSIDLCIRDWRFWNRLRCLLRRRHCCHITIIVVIDNLWGKYCVSNLKQTKISAGV